MLMNGRTPTSLEESLGSRFYWLGQCEGFRVDSPEGRYGLVEAVMFRSRPDEIDALIVRAGVLGRRLVIVPIEDVGDVLPRKERVVLRRQPDPGGADFLTELRTRLRRLAAAETGTQGLKPVPRPEAG